MAKVSEKKRIPESSKARLAAAILANHLEEGKAISKAEILRRAGYAPSTVDRGGGNSGKTPWTSEAFRDSLEKSGLGLAKIQQVLSDAAEAKTVAVYQGSATETDAPDHAIRLKAVKQIADISGLNVKRTQSVNVNIDTDSNGAMDLLGI